MNLMENRHEKLKSELLSLQRDYNDPNSYILPIPEKMGEEEFLSRLHAEDENIRYHLDGLREMQQELYNLYKDKKITFEEFYAKADEYQNKAQPFYDRIYLVRDSIIYYSLEKDLRSDVDKHLNEWRANY